MSSFRPSNYYRRKFCAGSMALEATIPGEAEDTEYSAEGSLLHLHMAVPMKPRDNLTPTQIELLEKAEAMEAEFLKTVTEIHA